MHKPEIVLVEDDDALRAALTDALTEESFRVVDFPDGAAALEYLEQSRGRSDLILLDLDLPRLDGGHLRRLLLADDCLARIPVVIVTARRHPDVHQIDASCVLLKPIPLAELLATVHALASPPHRRGRA